MKVIVCDKQTVFVASSNKEELRKNFKNEQPFVANEKRYILFYNGNSTEEENLFLGGKTFRGTIVVCGEDYTSVEDVEGILKIIESCTIIRGGKFRYQLRAKYPHREDFLNAYDIKCFDDIVEAFMEARAGEDLEFILRDLFAVIGNARTLEYALGPKCHIVYHFGTRKVKYVYILRNCNKDDIVFEDQPFRIAWVLGQMSDIYKEEE